MKNNTFYKAIAVILPLIVVFGNFSITGIEIAGLTLNLYRVLIPVFFVILFVFSIKDKACISIKPDSTEKKLYWMMLIWLLYGAVSIVLFPYADFHDGLLELLALLLGTISVAVVCMLCRENTWDYLIVGIKIAVIVVGVIAMYEIITANHLSTSRFSDPEFIRLYKEIIGEEAGDIKWHLATSVFYNENDCSAMLAIFSAFFLIDNKDNHKLWKRIINLFGLALIFSIMIFNNAFICFVAFVIGVIIALVFEVKGVINRIIPIIVLVVTRLFVALLSKILDINTGLAGTLLAQLDNNANGMGSLYLRINTYKVTLYETFATSKGMGFGAGSFSKYFGQFVDSHMIMSNPHCFWFEILAEYGIVVFLLFVCILVMMMAKLIIKYYKTRDSRCILIIAAGASLIIASVAPSSFLTYGYYWILIGLAVFLSDSGIDVQQPIDEKERMPFGDAAASA